MAEAVTIAIVNYNGRKDLEAAILSMKDMDYPEFSIMLVDDASTDGSADFVRLRFPDVKVVDMGENVRFRGKYPLANRGRNRALQESETRLVFLADNDILLARDCLSQMVEVLETIPDCAVCTPRVMIRETPDTIYSDGTVLHYVCASVSEGRNRKISGEKEDPKYSLGCGIQLLDRDKAAEIGYMDESYVVGWGDDGEFHHRMNLAGYRVYNVPQAMVYHPKKESGFRVVPQVRNRLYFIWQTYALKTILMAAPALMVYDLMLFTFLVMKGGLKEYAISVADFWRHLPKIFRDRKRIQATRALKDRDLMTVGDIFVAEHVLNNPILRLAMGAVNGFFNAYWKLIRHAL